jgi:hypothetical protein
MRKPNPRSGKASIAVAVVLSSAATVLAGDSYWSRRAREVAERRLAAATETRPQSRAAHLGPASDRQDDSAESAVAPLFAGGAGRPVFRLVADVPETRPADDPQAAENGPQTRPQSIERGPLPGFFETVKRDLKEAPRVLWHDTKAVYGNPWNLAFLVGAGGASLALRPEADDDIEDHFDKHHTFGRDERNAFDWIGNPATGAVMAGTWYLVGQVSQDAKTYEVGKKMASALIITDLSTVLFKVAACTDSPNGEPWAWPSGHMSSTMAVATVLADAYGPVVGIPAYGAAAFVGIQRLDGRDHHLSDVVFGAALGWVVAHTVMKEHAPEIAGGELVPYVDPPTGGTGLAWVKSFDVPTPRQR